ncbi:SspB-related isopeptide-forming adhesin [Hutsoniella sourekii]|uniref:SspB-related isopeptide-forming adhesin n=1 Tax=Hutsoniella sourekii TaxID=87650 RepID=UPI00047F2634|nr:SspB-related isopeptide-forming adhesin [Hutsoniella sourekii]
MEIKQKYALRKDKRYGLCSAVIATALISGVTLHANHASAQELEATAPEGTGLPATNLPEAQPAPTPAQETLDQAATAGTQGTTEIAVDNTSVEVAAETQKDNLVVTEETKDLGVAQSEEELSNKRIEIEKDQEKQVAEITNKGNQYQAEKTQHNKEIEKYNQEKAQYDQEKAQYDKDKQKYDQDKSQYDQDQNQFVEDLNQYNNDKQAYDQALQKYQQDLVTYNESKKQYDQAKIEHDQQVAEVNRKNQEIAEYNRRQREAYQLVADRNKNKIYVEGVKNPEDHPRGYGYQNYFSPSGSWTNRKSQSIGSFAAFVAEGQINRPSDFENNYSIYFYEPEQKIKESNIIKSINFWDVPITPLSGGSVSTFSPGEISYNTGQSSRRYKVRSGSWYRMPNAVTLQDGTRRDLDFRLTQADGNFANDYLYLWNDNNIINYRSANHGQGDPSTITAIYQVAGHNNEDFLWVNAAVDIDFGQYLYYDKKTTDVLSVGGGLYHYDGMFGNDAFVQSDKDLGWTWGRHTGSSGLRGKESAPDGIAVFVTYGSTYWKKLQNYNGGITSGIADGDFAVKVNFSVPTLKERIPITPPTFNVVDPTPPTPPVEPNAPTPPAPPSDEPAKPTVTIYDYRLRYQPGNVKDVTNTDGVIINGHKVPKGSEVRWVLNNDVLKKNRETIVSYTMEDALPSGFEVDREKTALATPAYTLSFDPEKNTVTFTATQATLNAFNADKTSQMYVPIATIVGRVLNDKAVYENRFLTTIHTPNNNKITVPSNKVIVETPGGDNPIDPVKTNKNQAGIIINGKPVVAGSDNLYTLTWDLDQYKGIKSTQEAIRKGFYYVDDYPEEAVVPKTQRVSITDNQGQAVSGITVNNYNSLSEAPQEIVDMLKNADIANRLKGSFQVFSVDNPEKFFNEYVVKGINLTIVTPMTVKEELAQLGATYKNNAFQVDFGNGYYTNEVTNNVPVPDPQKQNLNKDGVNINGTVVPVGTTNVYTMKWDFKDFKEATIDPDVIAKGLFFVDDYPEEVVTIDTNNVRLTDQNGQAVEGVSWKTYQTIAEAPEHLQEVLSTLNIKGAFQLFTADDPTAFTERYVKTGSDITIQDPMVVHQSLHGQVVRYDNKAFQINYGTAFETEVVTNTTPPVDPDKQAENTDGVNINGTVVLAGDTINYQLTWNLDGYKGIKATKADIANGFFHIDDYPEEALNADASKVIVVDQNGEAAIGLNKVVLNSINEASEAIQEAFRKANYAPKGAFLLTYAEDPEDFYNRYVVTGTNLYITAPMVVKESTKDSGQMFENQAVQIEFNNKSATDVVQNIVPDVEPEKDNYNTDQVLINGKPVLVGSTNNYKVTWNLSPYKGIKATKDTVAKGFHLFDDYPEEAVIIDTDNIVIRDNNGDLAVGVTVTQYSEITQAPEAIQALIQANGYQFNGAFQVFSAQNPVDFYNRYVVTGIDLIIENPMVVKKEAEGKTYTNTAFQTDFGQGYQTKTVENKVPKPDPKKENLNENMVDINGKTVAAGSVNVYKLTWDLTDYQGINATVDEVAKGFFYLDDYPEEALIVNAGRATVTDQDGQAVEGITIKTYSELAEAPDWIQTAIANSNMTIKGAFQIFSADNPKDFYQKYVQTGQRLTILTPMTVKDEMGVTGGSYENTAYQFDFGLGYQTETVVNNVPTSEPKKENLNQAGVNINGKNVLPGSVNVYKLTWDLDQYMGIYASKETIAKGFYFFDDYPEEALLTNPELITITDMNGEPVTGITYTVYKSLQDAPENLQNLLANSGIQGAFQVFSADDPEDFFTKYVFTGTNIVITNPMTVRKEMAETGGKYTNKAFQSEFGIVKETDVVENNVPKIEPEKDVTIDVGGDSINNGIVEYGQTFNYRLVGASLPSNRSDELFEYRFIDDYQESHDRYDGIFKVFALKDIKLKDGTVIPAGTEITEYAKQTHDEAKGIVDIALDEDFLRSIDLDSEFQAELYLQMTRINYGSVDNEFTNVINGVEVLSNKVTTHTPQPDPEKPDPQKPSKGLLPETGEGLNSYLSLAGLLALVTGIFGFKKKKDEAID